MDTPLGNAPLRRQIARWRIDPLGLRKLLPQRVLDWLFARFALLVRRGIQEDEGIPEASVDDFPIGPAGPADIDLLAVCRRPRSPG